MTLGNNNIICKEEFKEAMRPIARDNVDRKDVDANFGALGTAVHSILTARADVVSASTNDAEFWQWIKAVDAWLRELQKRHPELPELAESELPALPTAPTQLRGKIR